QKPDSPVIVVEGEKKAEPAEVLFPGHAAITSQGGCRAAGKADWTPLAGRDVVIWPDHDAEGATYAADVARLALEAGAASVRIIQVPLSFPPKWDLADVPPSDVTIKDLRALLDSAEPFSPHPEESRVAPPVTAPSASADAAPRTEQQLEAEIGRLAGLSPIAYDRERTAAARRLKCRVTTLDAAVRGTRPHNEGGSAMQGRAIELPKPEPWPQPVTATPLLDALVCTLRQYVIVTREQAEAVALWVIHSHTHDASDTSPKLVLKSAEKRSGKTRLVEVLSRVVARPLAVSGISAAALLRVIELNRPTVLLDEMDALMRGNREMAETLRGFMNSGFDRGTARMIKNVPLPDGGWEPREFSTWCPQVLSGIGDLPETVRDRSIEIVMKRKLPSEKVKRLRRRDGGELAEIARKLVRWAGDNMATLREAEPAIPDGLHDRAADAWEPLFAIADLAGGEWPNRGRKAAVALSGAGAAGEDNIGSMLLADCREVFANRNGRISSAELVNALAYMAERPWADWRHGKSITQATVAALLKRYEITTHNVRFGERTLKGYEMADFEDAFSRYLVPESHAGRRTATSVAAEGFSAESKAPHPSTMWRAENAANPSNGADCGGVASSALPTPDEAKTWTA
ncbi:MAG: DUF3631 domain-containing protein, partial [Stellaceae bacterium]